MTERKQVHPKLKQLPRQAVDVDFDGGTLTSDGGLMLLREVDRRLDLIQRIDEAIPDPRDPLYTSHPQSEILTSRIFGRCSQQIKSGKSNSTPRVQYPA